MPIQVCALIILILALSNQIFSEEAVILPSSSIIENRLAEIEVIEVTSHKPIESQNNSSIDPDIVDIIKESNKYSHDKQVKVKPD